MPSVQANFYVLFAEVEHSGSLGCAQSFDIAQHDYGTELLGKGKQSALQKLAKLGPGRSLLWVRRSLHDIHTEFSIVFGVVQLLVAFARVKPAQRFVNRNACQPSRKGRASGKLVQVLIRSDISILHYV